MRITHSQEQWQTIIEDQQNSALPIIDYCQQQQLIISIFYAVRKKFSLLSGNFVCANITQQVEFVEQQTAIIVNVGQASFSVPASSPVTFLSLLLCELI
jgi:putative transposase